MRHYYARVDSDFYQFARRNARDEFVRRTAPARCPEAVRRGDPALEATLRAGRVIATLPWQEQYHIDRRITE